MSQPLLSSPSLLSHGRPLVPLWRVVSIRQSRFGGRGTAIYYTLPPPPPPCPPRLRRAPQRVQTDVDDPTQNPSISSWVPVRGLRVTLVVNGAAGPGRARALANRVVAAVLREAGLEVDVLYTEGVGHAADLAAEAVVGGARAVVAVGGDGTLHETLNGVVRGMARGGSGTPVVGIVPAGSGNAVAHSVGIANVLDGALNVVHALRTGGEVSMGLMEYGRLRGRKIERESLSLCGAQWGLFADVDFGTEGMRWMGDTRFDIGALWCVLKGKGYYGRIRMQLDRAGQMSVDKKLEAVGGGSRGRVLERVGDEDVVLEGRFITVVAWNVAYQSKDVVATPYANVHEPCFDAMVVRDGACSRFGLLKVMLAITKGTDEFIRGCPAVEYYKCRRLVMERLEGRYVGVDGESVPVEPFSLRMAPETGRVKLLLSEEFSEATQSY